MAATKRGRKSTRPRRSPDKVPLGSGLANRARGLLRNRGRQIDDLVESQVTRR